VDDLAVARGNAGADRGGCFRDDHFVPRDRRGARDRKPDHARSDHEDLHPPCTRTKS